PGTSCRDDGGAPWEAGRRGGCAWASSAPTAATSTSCARPAPAVGPDEHPASSSPSSRRDLPAMKFLVLTLISNGPDPVTGRTPSPHERFRRVVSHAVL